MDELEIESAHLVGTSYGGEVGLTFAAAYPRRVRSLAVIASVAKPDDALREGALRWAQLAREKPERLWDAALPRFYSPRFVAANPAFIEAGRQRVSALPPDWFRAFADLCEAFAGLDADLAAIRCPTLVVAGADDTLKPPRFSRELADGIAGAELVVIEDAGHAVVVEKPDAVNEALLRFLAKPAPPTAHRS
jgi:pimeloyl-ACP methyl ester carboxylesterase